MIIVRTGLHVLTAVVLVADAVGLAGICHQAAGPILVFGLVGWLLAAAVYGGVCMFDQVRD